MLVIKHEKSFYHLISISPDSENYPKIFHTHDVFLQLKIQNQNCLCAIEEKKCIYSVSLSLKNDAQLNLDLFFSQNKNDSSAFKTIQLILPYYEAVISHEIAFIHCFHTKNINYNVIVSRISPSQTIDLLVTFLIWFENGKFLIKKLNSESLFGYFSHFNYQFHHSLNGFFRLKNIFCFDLSLKVFSIKGKCLINTYSNYEMKSRIFYCSNGYLLNEINSSCEYLMVRPININIFDTNTY